MTGAQLRRRRSQLGLTQVQLADRLGVTSNTVARWERGELLMRKPMVKLITLLSSKVVKAKR